MGLVKVEFETILLKAGPGFEQDQLEAAFSATRGAQEGAPHWKDRIDAWVPVEDLDMVRAAIIHFTGSVLEEVDSDEVGGWVRIKAAGYWRTIGA